MTKEEAFLAWMKESKHHIEHDWSVIKKSSWWEAFSRGYDAGSASTECFDAAYKYGFECGSEVEKYNLEKNT